MNKIIEPALKEGLQNQLRQNYQAHLSEGQQQKRLEQFAITLGQLYLDISLQPGTGMKNTYIFSHTVEGEAFIGYLIWSEDLAIQETEASTAFLFLSSFGFISGMEIRQPDNYQYSLWPTLIGEEDWSALAEGFDKLMDELVFIQKNPLVLAYHQALHAESEKQEQP